MIVTHRTCVGIFFIFIFIWTCVVCLGQEARWPDIWFWYILCVLCLPAIMIEMECRLELLSCAFFFARLHIC